MGKQVKTIPDEIRAKVIEIVNSFNQGELRKKGCLFEVRFKGKFLYLDRVDSYRESPICRLKYNGHFEEWEFAIFKWSSERYDSEEWFFPGSQFVNGTIEGAMKAGMAAYPV